MEPAKLTETPQGPAQAEFYYCPNYGGRGARVILLVGSGWRQALRDHYGITGKAFHSRPAHREEPRFYPNRHPWGWVFEPGNVVKYESHWLPESELRSLQAKIDACAAATEELSPA